MTQRNPWLDIPAADYLGHMGSPEVGQLDVLGELFREALVRFQPADVLLLGCATGNGLAHVDPSVTRRVTGIDINQEYLTCLEARFPVPGFELDLECADVMAVTFESDAYDLVHCGLLFEYLEWAVLMPALGRAIRRGGGLGVVLQRPSDSSPAVTRTDYPSLRQLERTFHFVEPPALIAEARLAGLDLDAHRVQPLASGKAFDVMYFTRGGDGS